MSAALSVADGRPVVKNERVLLDAEARAQSRRVLLIDILRQLVDALDDKVG